MDIADRTAPDHLTIFLKLLTGASSALLMLPAPGLASHQTADHPATQQSLSERMDTLAARLDLSRPLPGYGAGTPGCTLEQGAEDQRLAFANWNNWDNSFQNGFYNQGWYNY